MTLIWPILLPHIHTRTEGGEREKERGRKREKREMGGERERVLCYFIKLEYMIFLDLASLVQMLTVMPHE